MSDTIPDSGASSWLHKSAAWLRSVGIPTELGTGTDAGTERNTTERLKATLRRGSEVLSPRELRRLLADLQGAAASELSDIEGGRLAEQVMQWYGKASAEQRLDLWHLLCEQFVPDVAKIQQVRQKYEDAIGTASMGAAERQLRRAMLTPRLRLLQRFAVLPRARAFCWICALNSCRNSRPTNGWARSMPIWNTCSRPGLTWRFWRCAA